MGVRRSLQALSRVNQPGGFDCPGCAWPEAARARRDRVLRERREGGGARGDAPAALARSARAHEHSRSCSRTTITGSRRKGVSSSRSLRRAGATHFEPIGWDAAFAHVAAELRDLDSPDQAVFYTSGRASNEAAFLWQLFARQLGTNNLPDCSNLCHESSGEGLGEAIGVGKGTVSLEDIERAGAIFVIGQNPGTNHPRMLTTLAAAKRRGARIVAINPLRERGPRALRASAGSARAGSGAAPRSRISTCRCAWAATWRCSRAS